MNHYDKLVPKGERARKGDWVRYMVNGRIVIANVEYITRTLTGFDVYTDWGRVSEESILEIRSSELGGKGE